MEEEQEVIQVEDGELREVRGMERREREFNIFFMMIFVLARILFYTWVGTQLFYPTEYQNWKQFFYNIPTNKNFLSNM